MAPTFACRSHRDNVPCATSTSAASAFADQGPGPVIFFTIPSLNFAECCILAAASRLLGHLKREAATILTDAGAKAARQLAGSVLRKLRAGASSAMVRAHLDGPRWKLHIEFYTDDASVLE